MISYHFPRFFWYFLYLSDLKNNIRLYLARYYTTIYLAILQVSEFFGYISWVLLIDVLSSFMPKWLSSFLWLETGCNRVELVVFDEKSLLISLSYNRVRFEIAPNLSGFFSSVNSELDNGSRGQLQAVAGESTVLSGNAHFGLVIGSVPRTSE